MTQLAPAATIKGRIVEDHSGAPVPSASVRIFKTGERLLAADLETDGDGRFDAPELGPGDYRIDISKPNYLNATVRLKLTGGEAISNLRLIRCGVIAGHVLDRHGQPVRGALVHAMPKPSAGAPLMPDYANGHYAIVDARGNYRIYNLTPGPYAVAVSYGASRFAMGSSGSASTSAGLGSGFLFYPDNAHPQFLAISPGEERRNFDFTIGASNLHSVGGKVNLAAPKDRYWLALTPLDQPALAVAVTQMGDKGEFRITGVPAGSYHLFAAKTSGGRTPQGALLDSEPSFARSRIDIVTEDIADLNVAPERGRTASVVMHLDKSTEPASACPRTAQLVLTPLEDWGVDLNRRSSLTLDKPEPLANLAPARYSVSLTELGETCYATVNPVLDLNAEAGPFVITIAPAGSIHGELSAGSESPSGYAIVLMPEDATGGAPTVLVALPDAESRFAFPNLRPGRYRIAAQPAASQSRWLSDSGTATEVEVSGGVTAELTLAAPPPKQ